MLKRILFEDIFQSKLFSTPYLTKLHISNVFFLFNVDSKSPGKNVLRMFINCFCFSKNNCQYYYYCHKSSKDKKLHRLIPKDTKFVFLLILAFHASTTFAKSSKLRMHERSKPFSYPLYLSFYLSNKLGQKLNN